MSEYVLGCLLLSGVVCGAYLLGSRRGTGSPALPPAPLGKGVWPAGAAAAASRGVASSGRIVIDDLNPSEILRLPAFEEGVRWLRGCRESSPSLAAYASPDGDPVLGCMALEALSRRAPDKAVGLRLLANVGRVRPQLLFCYLRALPKMLPTHALVGDVLFAIVANWDTRAIRELSVLHDVLREFTKARIAAGERPGIEDRLEAVSDAILADLLVLVTRLALPGLAPIEEAATRRLSTRVDREFLDTIGRVWTDESGRAAVARIVAHEKLDAAVEELLSVLAGDQPRSALLVGPPGVGKSVIARLALQRMQGSGWTIFEASSTQLQAGQTYLGQIEERLVNLVRATDSRRKVIWYVPDFSNLGWIGRHSSNPTSVLEQLLPHIERGTIVVLGESQPGPFHQLTRRIPRCGTDLRCVRVEPMDESTTLALARRWVAAEAGRLGVSADEVLGEPLLRESWQLVDQYLRERAAPGNLLQFLDTVSHHRLSAAHGGSAVWPGPLTADDLIVTLTSLTGLPASILDERHVVDLVALRQFFETRVIGQPEAVDCLVERLAMIKARLTDPKRPAGVFLFPGPTGTGKTQIAKTLASFLFGSEDRMIRLDMSEFQTPDSVSRILGDPVSSLGGDGAALTEAIRKQPFSVVLLDEFEKAHPAIWDLFLQVFGEGRLTDRQGVVADFRQAIIVLTSNLGSKIPTGRSLGFSGAASGFRSEMVLREIDRSFRREFMNRIDRIVVFRPLGRETMLNILHREIGLAMQLPGLRDRGWAVRWEQSALEFLLEQGFTTDMGARPLKRAIEHHFLAPLAATIVGDQCPHGDQILCVRTGGAGLDVVFVDPTRPQ